MLQIVTGMYFRDVLLNETLHRAVFYTSSWTYPADAIELPVGRFLFASSPSKVCPIAIEAVERLEAIRPDGEPEIMVATGGTELLDDAAAVFAFALNITCSRNAALVERLVPHTLGGPPASKPSNILRRTFDPEIFLRPEDFDEAREFCSKLLALQRSHFEAVMRAIHRVVDATYLVGDDPSLAYTLFVAALESLAQIATSPEETRSWDIYDPKKRKIIDATLTDLDPEQATKVRNGVLEADQLSLARRFRTFTLDHVEPSFYRLEATSAIRPIRSHDLPNALDVAYRFRSRNVHTLEILAPELWVISDRADTLPSEGRSVLSLEGLNRLCRHVIKVFVERSPTDLDQAFDYRDHLPGIVKMQMAPQYWIGNAEGFTPQAAPAFLEGFIELLLDVLADQDDAQLVDLTAVLEKIEQTLLGEAKPESRQPMIALYVLWHTFLNPRHHRPGAAKAIQQYRADLDPPSVVGFVVRLLTSQGIEWPAERLLHLVNLRRDELQRGRGQALPARLNTALILCAAERLLDAQQVTEALSLISEAVESLPGDMPLIAFEQDARAGDKPTIDLLDFVLAKNSWQSDDGVPTESGVADSEETEPQEEKDAPS